MLMSLVLQSPVAPGPFLDGIGQGHSYVTGSDVPVCEPLLYVACAVPDATGADPHPLRSVASRRPALEGAASHADQRCGFLRGEQSLRVGNQGGRVLGHRGPHLRRWVAKLCEGHHGPNWRDESPGRSSGYLTSGEHL